MRQVLRRDNPVLAGCAGVHCGLSDWASVRRADRYFRGRRLVAAEAALQGEIPGWHRAEASFEKLQ